MRENKSNYIKCPNCGAEYLPAEIYLPNHFLGKPKYIEKEHNTGKVKDFFGSDMNLKEKYICDYCNTSFKVKATVKFFTQEIEEEDFSKDYITKYKKVPLFLSEE